MPKDSAIVLAGNFSDGFRAHGPFASFDAAAAYCDLRLSAVNTWVMGLEAAVPEPQKMVFMLPKAEADEVNAYLAGDLDPKTLAYVPWEGRRRYFGWSIAFNDGWLAEVMVISGQPPGIYVRLTDDKGAEWEAYVLGRSKIQGPIDFGGHHRLTIKVNR
jgi:hypothetical protein